MDEVVFYLSGEGVKNTWNNLQYLVHNHWKSPQTPFNFITYSDDDTYTHPAIEIYRANLKENETKLVEEKLKSIITQTDLSFEIVTTEIQRRLNVLYLPVRVNTGLMMKIKDVLTKHLTTKSWDVPQNQVSCIDIGTIGDMSSKQEATENGVLYVGRATGELLVQYYKTYV